MNELICAVIIASGVIVIGGLIFIGGKIMPNIMSFIKWQRFRLSKNYWEED